jgi:hypothetical protein
VHLEISSANGRLRGSVALDVSPTEGSGCPVLRKRYLLTEVVLAEGILSLADSGGHHWDLVLERDGRALHGMMAWQQGGADEPLAEGFTLPDGTTPRSRLSGEIRLVKAAAPGAAATDADEERTTSAGQHIGNIAAVLGAAAVGGAAVYGVNRLGRGSSEEGTITCSPRRCVVGAPGEPCFCEGNVVSGWDCGETETGIPIGGSCSFPTMPCEALLSCNSGICEDRYGRCPFN